MIAVSDEQVDDVPECHWYEYGNVPPEGFAVNVTLCPESIVGDAGVTDPADSVELSVIIPDFILFFETGVVALQIILLII